MSSNNVYDDALAKAVERREWHRSVLLSDAKKATSLKQQQIEKSNSSSQLPYPETTTTSSLQAELIDDVQAHHAKMMQAAKADILSKAVLAEVHDDDADGKASRRLLASVALVLLVGIVVVASVCGTGQCGARRVYSTEHIVEAIQAVTTSVPQYIASSSSNTSSLTPQERALQYVVEQGVEAVGIWRFIQRYGVCVVLFATTSDTWLAAQPSHEECSWNGIACDANGRIVEINALQLPMMVGTLPDDLGVLTDLTALHLADQGLVGTLPTTLTQLTRLATLDLTKNGFTGSVVPTVVQQLSRLQHYRASDNAFTGTIPTLRSMTQHLHTLDLRYNRGLRGTVPTELAALTQLTSLSLGGHGVLTGPFPTFLQHMTTLRHLAIEPSAFTTDSIDLTLYTQLTQLTHLRLVSVASSSPSSSTIPSILADAFPQMETFQVLRNGFRGTLPPELAQWTALTSFSVLGNGNMTGTIPAEYFAAWTHLRDVQLWDNRLTGTIPTTVAALEQLEYWDVSENRLTGTVPTQVGVMTRLRRFAVQDNRLTGTIPVEVLNFASTSTVWMELNDFTGVAPFCASEENAATPIVSSAKVDCDEVSCPCCSSCQGDEER